MTIPKVHCNVYINTGVLINVYYIKFYKKESKFYFSKIHLVNFVPINIYYINLFIETDILFDTALESLEGLMPFIVK